MDESDGLSVNFSDSFMSNNCTKPLINEDGWKYYFGLNNPPGITGMKSNDNWKPAHPQYSEFKKRLISFQDFPVQLNQKPIDLAAAGFFYFGKADACFCFFCGKGIRKWEFYDIPLLEHRKWSPGCVFLNMISDTGCLKL